MKYMLAILLIQGCSSLDLDKERIDKAMEAKVPTNAIVRKYDDDGLTIHCKHMEPNWVLCQ